LFAGPSAGSRSAGGGSVLTSTSHGPGDVYFRPVLCLAPPYDANGQAADNSTPSCDAAHKLSRQHIDGNPGNPEAAANAILPEGSLENVPSTKPSVDTPSSTVLLPAVSGAARGTGISSDSERYVLGPAQMSSHAIASATVQKSIEPQPRSASSSTSVSSWRRRTRGLAPSTRTSARSRDASVPPPIGAARQAWWRYFEIKKNRFLAGSDQIAGEELRAR
jgi:hypothetical protein